jgi:phosphate transport system permease protein
MSTEAPSANRPLRSKGMGRHADRLFGWLLLACGLSVLVVLAAMVLRTVIDSIPVFQYQGVFDFFFGTQWTAGHDVTGAFTGTYGAFPFIFGTLYTSAIALVIALPAAIGVALYINFYANRRLRTPLSYTVEVLAAVPSIIFGLWGLLWFVPTILHPFTRWVSATFGESIPWLSSPVPNVNYFHAGFVLAIMILPIITAITREVLATTPVAEVQAAYGLGATRWEVLRSVVLVRGFSGIVGASILGLGRALGETVAVLMLVGGSQKFGSRLFFPGDTLASHIAATFQDAAPETLVALTGIGVVLFVITMVVNIIARLIVWRFGRLGGVSL